MKKLALLASLLLITACTPSGQQCQMDGKSCPCCAEMMKDSKECCCKGMKH